MLERTRALLLVIDLQERLMPAIAGGDAVLEQTVRLVQFAGELKLPIVWTEQYPKGLGATVPRLAEAFTGARAIEKTSFGCFGEPAFVEELERLGRRQVLVAGVETHVCVMQTVLAALDTGFEVFVARDATGSRRPADYAAALERMAQHGAELVTTEMALFEMLRDAATPEFKRVRPLLKGA